MSYLFYIDEKNKCVIHPEIVKLCPSFHALNEKEILYIVLAFDYSSIYKQFPVHDRKRKAMWHAFEENEEELVNSSRILAAAEDYISLQYNPKIEVAKVYQQKIDEFLQQIQIDDSPTSIKKTDEAISILQSRIKSLETEVDEKIIDGGVVKGKMTLSFLEKAMSNMKHYKSITSKK